MAIILDTETTGLLMPNLAPVESQPQIIEIYAAKFNEETFEVIDEFETFVKPLTLTGDQLYLEDPINKIQHICRITNIYDYMLTNAPLFSDIAISLNNFFKNEDLVVGQNIMFDLDVLRHNYRRINKENLFYDFNKKACTIEMSYPLNKKRTKLGDLYQMATGQVLENAHRAKDDTLATLKVYQWLLEEGF